MDDVIVVAASLFDRHDVPEDFAAAEYARGVTDLATRLLGLGQDDMVTVWRLIRRAVLT